jgi:ribosomal protein S18 acetylase RimI-like enzyme
MSRRPPHITVRPVTPLDADAVVSLWRIVFPEYSDPSRPQRDPRASVARKLAFGDELFWVAEEERTVVGTVMAGYDGHRGWIYSLGVRPDARRGGVGRVLLETAERALADLGCPKVNLQVMADNEVAQKFWRAAGYAPDHVVSFGKRLM